MADSKVGESDYKGGGKTKGVGYYAKCFWNEKKTTLRLQELLDAKDGTIATLKNKLEQLTKEVKNG